MNIDNNYYNSHANHSSLAFKASLNTELPIKNVKRFINIKNLFAQKTQHYPYDTLTLTMSKDPAFEEYPILTTNTSCIDGDDYKYSHLIESFDELMDNLSDNQIVKKFVNYFKMLKKEEEFDTCVNQANKTINHLTEVKSHNDFLADCCKEEGRTKLASQYRTISKSIQGKIDSVSAKHEAEKARLLADMDKIAKKEPELGFVSDIFGTPCI